MLSKQEIEQIISDDFFKVLTTERIYKYETFDTALNHIILGGTLMFSHPDIFNDPFDCNEYLIKPSLTDEMIDNIMDSLIPNESQQWKNMLKERLANPENVAQIIREYKDKFRLSCFSETEKEVLMWSHYSDKHNGICIGFTFPHNYQDKFILCGARYLKKIKPIDGKTDFLRTSLFWLTSKSIRWKYEQEIRAIRQSESKDFRELIQYERKFIKEIIFGCNVSQEKIELTIKKIEDSLIENTQIEYSKMVIDKNTFLLDKIKI